MPKLVGISIGRLGMSYIAIDEAGRVWRGTLRRSRAEADYTTSTGRRPGVPEGVGTTISAISARLLENGLLRPNQEPRSSYASPTTSTPASRRASDAAM